VSVRTRSLVFVLIAALAGACSLDGGGSAPPSPACSTGPSADACEEPGASPTAGASPEASASTAPSGEPTALSVGLGYIASVQFAPFYLAEQSGYFAEAGLDVTFRHGFDYDVIALVGQGELDLGLADGTSVIPAVSNGIPLRYVATIYGQFPSVVFAKASAGIDDPSELAGRKVGIPGRYGSSWIMLQAMLSSVGLTVDDIELSEIGFTQAEAVTQGLVEAATGFTNNEPVVLESNGVPTSVLRVDDIVPLPGNGLIVGASTLEAKRDAITAFVAVILRAMADIEADPELGLDAALTEVPDLATAREAQAAILDATIEVWRGPVQEAEGLGAISTQDWDRSIDYLTSLDLVPDPVTAADMVDTSLLPPGG
jgi:NitT/TauT family transport system substrate-binding protein